MLCFSCTPRLRSHPHLASRNGSPTQRHGLGHVRAHVLVHVHIVIRSCTMWHCSIHIIIQSCTIRSCPLWPLRSCTIRSCTMRSCPIRSPIWRAVPPIEALCYGFDGSSPVRMASCMLLCMGGRGTPRPGRFRGCFGGFRGPLPAGSRGGHVSMRVRRTLREISQSIRGHGTRWNGHLRRHGWRRHGPGGSRGRRSGVAVE